MSTVSPLQLLANLPPVHLFTIITNGAPDDLSVGFLSTVNPTDILPRFTVPQGAPLAATDNATQLVEWGRINALQERAHEQAKRQAKSFEAQQVRTAWENYAAALAVWESKPGKGKDEKAPTKPTEASIEGAFRTHPEYGPAQALVEATREAFSFTSTVIQALKTRSQDLASFAKLTTSGA